MSSNHSFLQGNKTGDFELIVQKPAVAKKEAEISRYSYGKKHKGGLNKVIFNSSRPLLGDICGTSSRFDLSKS